MADTSLTPAGATAAPAPAAYNKKNVGYGIVVMVLLAGGIVFAVLKFTGRSSAGRVHCTVYYKGMPDISADTKVYYRSTSVGQVDSVRPVPFGLQLTVVQKSLPELQRSVTVTPAGQGGDITGNISVAIAPAADALTLRSGPTEYRFTRADGGNWALPVSKSRGLIVNNTSFDTLPATSPAIVVRAGDVVDVYGSDVLIQWGETGVYSKVCFSVDTAGLTKAVAGFTGKPVQAAGLFAPGTAVAVVSSLGLARPNLSLQPSFAWEAPSLQTPLEGRELLPQVDLDLQTVLNSMGGYLTQAKKYNAPPSNRFERAVADVNGVLAALNGLTGNLESRYLNPIVGTVTNAISGIKSDVDSIAGPASGLIKSLNKDTLKAIINNLNATISTLKRVTDTVDKSTLKDVSALLKKLNGTTLPALNDILGTVNKSTLPHVTQDVDELTLELRSTMSRLKQTLEHLDSIIP